MINTNLIKENVKFIFVSLGIIVLAFLLTLLIDSKQKYEIVELDEKGNSSVHKLVINEIMSSNDGSYASEDGSSYDWIEIYNGSKKDINLKNYGLSDNETVKWVFPETIIKKGEYLIVNLSGKNAKGLNANFKLSSGGKEKVFIKDAGGKVIDGVETISLEKNESMARDLDGNWIVTDTPTPGYINTIEGFNKYYESLLELDNNIKINEVLPDNNGNYMNSNNEFVGYIEVINLSNKTIDLENYAISNTKKAPFKWKFPNIKIKAKQTIAIYMDSKYEELTTSFKLSKKNGEVILTNNKGKIIDEVEYNNLPNGYALRRTNNEFYKTNVISPGYENTSDGENAFAKAHLKNKKELIINEVMNSNYNYLPQNGDKYYDWIEVKNNSNHNIKLNDYSLTTDNDILNMFKLPEVTLKPNELYVIMASGDTNLSNKYIHANFKISENESLYLVKNEEIIDSIYVANVPVGNSIGRNNNNGFYYMTPTPLEKNADGKIEVSIAPSFTTSAGVYNNIKELKIELQGPGTIYYTLDGSVPNQNDSVYKEPIELTKTTVVKAISYENGLIKSDVITNSYIINENHTMPVMSLSVDNVNSINYGEKETYAELFEDGKSFSVPCGIKLFGGSARSYSKKSFSLKFRKQYGMGSLNYKVFDNRDFSSFETLVLRTGSQDSQRVLFRDILMTSLVEETTDLDVQAYKTIILYINGKYWGIYDIREKVEEEFVSNHYNVDGEGTNIIRIDNDVTAGSITSYKELINYISTHDLKKQEYYEYVKTKIDIKNFCEYWAAETFIANNDIINQRFFSNPNVDSGKWKWIFYDLDYGMYNTYKDYFKESVSVVGISDFRVNTFLMRNLIKNQEFKQTYLEIFAQQLKTTWDKERILKAIDDLYNKFLPEMDREIERWSLSKEEWESRLEQLRNFVKKRPEVIVKHAKEFFDLSNKEMEKYFGEWL